MTGQQLLDQLVKLTPDQLALETVYDYMCGKECFTFTAPVSNLNVVKETLVLS